MLLEAGCQNITCPLRTPPKLPVLLKYNVKFVNTPSKYCSVWKDASSSPLLGSFFMCMPVQKFVLYKSVCWCGLDTHKYTYIYVQTHIHSVKVNEHMTSVCSEFNSCKFSFESSNLLVLSSSLKFNFAYSFT